MAGGVSGGPGPFLGFHGTSDQEVPITLSYIFFYCSLPDLILLKSQVFHYLCYLVVHVTTGRLTVRPEFFLAYFESWFFHYIFQVCSSVGVESHQFFKKFLTFDRHKYDTW